MSEEKIMMRTTFSGWRNVGKEKALAIARLRLSEITMGDSDEDRVALINRKFKGIVFSLKDLK